MKKTQKKKPPFLFYVIMIAFPLLFFILLETGLNIFDYGKNLDAFITISEEYDDLLFINPDIPFRYAINNSSPPAVAFDAYKKIKTDSTFRIFVMGGSSTAGFPYAYNITFPKYLQRKLNLLYPNMNIEVINLGITAHNSYTIADLADEVLEQEPDLILIYAGHNEYYGVLGVGSSVAYGNSRFVTKLMIFLNRTKTYQLINYLVKWGAGLLSEKEKPEFTDETLMARVIGESQILYNSEIYHAGIRQFRDNLNEFLNKINKAGINVIIGQLAFNYLQKPFISVSADENKNADSLFALGLTDYNAGQYNKAKQYLLEAKEHDVLRFRAPQAMNDVI
ncbi:MAG: SGNH/GDSL hydrolase family protein, partial [Melioribacteraceae bacterium]|nr:SGNH/GDSL hydrolase family protein [Melioribacteraceae bacterium]